jgi:superfamily II DNA or RNA helicase
MINSQKIKRQTQFVDKWSRQYRGNGTGQFPTGFGKTYCAIQAIKRIIEKHKFINCLIIIPTQVLKLQWERILNTEIFENKEIYYFKNTEKPNINIEVCIINSAIKNNKYYNNNYDLLILDEIHRYLADSFIKIFKIPHNWIMGLSATVNRKDGRHELLKELCPVMDTITVQEAKKNEWISDYKINKIKVIPSVKNKNIIDILSKNITEILQRNGGHFKIKLSPEYSQFNKLVGQRRKLVCGDENKMFEALKIIRRVNQKSIIFFEYIEHAETFYEMLIKYEHLKPCIYHSSIPINLRKHILEKFEKGEYRTLITVKSLNEGIRVNGASMGIICAANSVPRDTIQRLGRFLGYKKGKTAKLYQMILVGTVDETWNKSNSNEI